MGLDRAFLHDISNPLAALRVHIELLLEDAKAGTGSPERTLKSLEKSHLLVDRCVDLIKKKREELIAEGPK